MSDCAGCGAGQQQGLNTFTTLTVPGSNPDTGPVAVLSGSVAEKDWFVQGAFNGFLVLEGTHDGTNFAPVAKVTSTGADPFLKVSVKGTYLQMRVRRNAFATTAPTSGITSRATCPCP